MTKNIKGIELKGKRLKARYLILIKGYNQKETAKIVGVSERTMVKWVSKYNWNDQSREMIIKEGGSLSFFNEFLTYLNARSPHIHSEVSISWNDFLKRMETRHS